MLDSADVVPVNGANQSSHIVETDTPCLTHPEGRMVFHCRPDVNGRRLLFQDRNSRASSNQRQTAPVQLLAMDGRSVLGLSEAGRSSVSSSDPPFHPGQDDKLPRILVTTNPLTDSFSNIRLRQMQLMIAVAAVTNFLLTVALLCPADAGAWYHVDVYQSPKGLESVQRVIAVRPALLVIAMLSNGFLVLAAYFKMDVLLTIYVSVIAIVDIWSLMLLLPHALFLMRFLFDVLLVGVALEVRTHLEHTWFLTSFHRLRA
ncbi:hypothetical protein PC129_g7197 [Phytophthora cactorum]|uniref:Uncharacterized protein n=1 Tax=Phytophthora cactorum TaxID=29920 RepID=A0A329SZA5_9STRA|nr:hypothetical protein Pcac1_g23058 [Phytophthora cactorum]KAG3222085.1 hypothetical protein PC129_g7197 [Phytophthora cactorum]RAW42473.1 hypothetical protein PC110_g1328 [Phytophthora cactorum]